MQTETNQDNFLTWAGRAARLNAFLAKDGNQAVYKKGEKFFIAEVKGKMGDYDAAALLIMDPPSQTALELLEEGLRCGFFQKAQEQLRQGLAQAASEPVSSFPSAAKVEMSRVELRAAINEMRGWECPDCECSFNAHVYHREMPNYVPESRRAFWFGEKFWPCLNSSTLEDEDAPDPVENILDAWTLWREIAVTGASRTPPEWVLGELLGVENEPWDSVLVEVMARLDAALVSRFYYECKTGTRVVFKEDTVQSVEAEEAAQP